MYLVPRGDIARSHGVTFHAYADDCQLNSPFSREIFEIKQWMSANMFKLNDSKTGKKGFGWTST